MPRRDARLYLRDIVDACDAIVIHTRGCDEQKFRTDRTVRSATEREFSIIGEAVSQLSKIAPETFRRISQGERIARFRNILVHAYDLVRSDIMWRVVVEDLQLLRNEASGLLSELNSPPSN